eukprot:TRINITY_DN3592_c0_g1_i1.p1 TRINITY_DN3592_c0_g1~~TRINITY_DN3592_c0_g1_i1.p1  ORF type:complete len:331 (+),score=89.54 TRINITY_DN3592_c0_g1_i1:76-993(+)
MSSPTSIPPPRKTYSDPKNAPPIPLPSPGLFTDRQEIIHKPLPSLNGDGFLLYNVLSPEECKYFIAQSEEIGYLQLQGYKKTHRDNERRIVTSSDLSCLIFDRIKKYLPDTVCVAKSDEMRITSDFGTAGTWKLYNMNEMWRFCRYYPGGHFAPHLDGCFVRSVEERSMYTFMIYLNGEEDFKGGETNFLDPTLQLHMKNDKYQSPSKQAIIEQVVPAAGLAVIFLHPHLHEGAELISGTKYIMRSDIMYVKTKEDNIQRDEKEEMALKLFHEAQEVEFTDAMKAMELYRSAFKLWPPLARAYGN